VKVGDEIEAKILRVDPGDRKIGLSRKRLNEPDVPTDPATAPEARHAEARELRGGTGSASGQPLISTDSLSKPKSVSESPDTP
jgi:small subunit ribosomal protein S1